MRIHRGRGSNYHDSPHSNNGSTNSTTTSLGSASPERLSRFSTRKHEKVKISVSYPSSENISSPTHNQTANQLYAVHYSVNGKESSATRLYRGNSTSSGRGSVTSHNNNSLHKDFLSVTQDKMVSPRASKKMSKRNIKAQVKRFRMETKGELLAFLRHNYLNFPSLATTLQQKTSLISSFSSLIIIIIFFFLSLSPAHEFNEVENFFLHVTFFLLLTLC